MDLLLAKNSTVLFTTVDPASMLTMITKDSSTSAELAIAIMKLAWKSFILRLSTSTLNCMRE